MAAIPSLLNIHNSPFIIQDYLLLLRRRGLGLQERFGRAFDFSPHRRLMMLYLIQRFTGESTQRLVLIDPRDLRERVDRLGGADVPQGEDRRAARRWVEIAVQELDPP